MFWRRLLYFCLLIGVYVFFLFYKMWFAWYCLMMVIMLPIISGIVCGVIFLTVRINPDIPRVALLKGEAPVKLASKVDSVAGILTISAKGKIKDYMAGKTNKLKIKSTLNQDVHYNIDTSHCGLYEISITKVYVYDFFGIFRYPRKVNFFAKIIVKPTPVVPERMPELSGFKAKYLRKSSRPDSEIYDIREYVVGDSVKSIHWKVSAKKDKVLIKENQEEYNAHARVFLELVNDRDVVDKRLGELIFTSKYFLSHDIEHKVRVLPPYIREISFDIGNQYDIDKMLLRVLMMELSDEMMDINKDSNKNEEAEVDG